MSSASTTPYGLETVRGRGYRPDQVDTYLEALSQDRDAAWERAARLTVLAKDMEAEAARLRETVGELVPQTYESLGERAAHLYQLVLREAAEVREGARRAAREEIAEAEAYALDVHQAAREAADALREEAVEHARRLVLAARAEADELRIGARRGVKERRGEALAALREVRERIDGLSAEQAGQQAERLAAARREEAERLVALEACQAERIAGAEARVAEAERALREAEEAARRCEEQARVRAVEIVDEAHTEEKRIAQETERVLREHSEMWDEVQTHMDSVRNSLLTLTGRVEQEQQVASGAGLREPEDTP
ncbi:cellulose-binding protein [Streptomyces sp. NPDC005706]|uniref:cellulose-binding protein n=1 Tax=Streptomyces sp. NPDC005706 TaxID=3157169 RepID=UPI0033F13DB4